MFKKLLAVIPGAAIIILCATSVPAVAATNSASYQSAATVTAAAPKCGNNISLKNAQCWEAWVKNEAKIYGSNHKGFVLAVGAALATISDQTLRNFVDRWFNKLYPSDAEIGAR